MILKLQFLSKTAHASIHSKNEFLIWSLKRALGQCHHSRLEDLTETADESKGEDEVNLRAAMVALIRATVDPQPIQCLGFRSTIGDWSMNAVYNLAFWENERYFESRKGAPGVLSMIPLTGTDLKFTVN